MAPLVKHAFDAALLTDDPDAEAAGEVLPSHWRADHEITGVADEDHTHTDLQPLDSDLTAIAALTTTSYGRALLALADAAAGRTALSLGSAAVASTSDFDSAGAASSAVSSHAGASDPHPTYTTAAELAAYAQPLDSDLTAIAALTTTSYGRSLLAAADAAALRTLAGAVIGTDVEAHDADLTTFAGLTPTNDDILQRKSGAWTNRTIAQLATDLGLASGYQPLDSDLTAIAALTTTSFGRGLLTSADAAALRTTAGLVIGTDVEAHDSDLTAIAGLSASNDDIIQRKAGAWTNRTMAQLVTDLALGSTYQPVDSDLTAIAALTTTSFGRSLLTMADAATVFNALAPLTTKGDLIGESGGGNVANPSGGASSSNGDSTDPNYAFNGIFGSDSASPSGTGWRSNQSSGSMLYNDLGSAMTIGSIRVVLGTGGSRQFDGWQLAYSDNNSTWTDVSGASIPHFSSDTTVTFTPITHRYWRLAFGPSGLGGDCIEWQILAAVSAVRVPAGTDGKVLQADSTATPGISYTHPKVPIKAGTPTDSDVLGGSGAANGMKILDSTGHNLWIRDGGTWLRARLNNDYDVERYPASPALSDEFDTGSLNGAWGWTGTAPTSPAPDLSTYPGWLYVTVPTAAATGFLRRAYVPGASTDFTVVTKVRLGSRLDSTVVAGASIALLTSGDTSIYEAGIYGAASGNRWATDGRFIDSNGTSITMSAMSAHHEVYIMVQRTSANVYMTYISWDGMAWQKCAGITSSTAVAKIALNNNGNGAAVYDTFYGFVRAFSSLTFKIGA